MKRIRRMLSLLVLGLLLTALQAYAQYGSPSGTTTVSVTVGTMAGLTVNTSTTSLTGSGSNFTGSTNLTYYIRTSATGGSGTITMKVTSDFSPTGGPSVASPPSAGDALTYTCTVASPGTACTGSQTASTTAITPLATFGANVHTTSSGSTASANWSLANDPAYKTGTYNATITFTISAA
jgi:hypothetical protein